MKVSLVQMDMKLGAIAENFAKGEELTRRAMASGADVVCLPETWNVGFFPREGLAELCDDDCRGVQAVFSPLARERGINLIAGSVANRRGGSIYNTACVFDRTGEQVTQYDKIHLFTPLDEHRYFTPGNRPARFKLDGVNCGLVICYDLRFPELIRTLTLRGIDVLFVVAQWPAARREHWQALCRARAIENQCFLAAVNSCGRAGEVRYGGASLVYDPWGNLLAQAGEGEEILAGELDLSVLEEIRRSIHVFRDRRPDCYSGLEG